MRAWVFQATSHKRKHGDGKAPWSVGYYDPAGWKRSKTIGSRSMAVKVAQTIHAQLVTDTFDDKSKVTWEAFIAEYESKVMAGMAARTKELTQFALNSFERIAKPVRVASIDTKTIDDFVSVRRTETRRGKEDAPTLAPASVNRELRHLRAVLRRAVKWGYLKQCPEVTFLREMGKVPTFITPEHFAALYRAADTATLPEGTDAGDWWRGLLIFAYMTGWRIGSILSLRWADVDLDKATAMSHAEDNKGKRDQRIDLHAIVVEHLRPLMPLRIPHDVEPVFPWTEHRRELYAEFERLQTAAGVRPEHTKARYGFHDLRRAFATMNASKLTADALQALMQHRSYSTTQRYINMANQIKSAVDVLYVPDVPRRAVAIG